MIFRRQHLFAFLIVAIASTILTALILTRMGRSEGWQLVEQAASMGGPAVPADVRGPLVNASSIDERVKILDRKWSSWPSFGHATERAVVDRFAAALVEGAKGDSTTSEQRYAMQQFLGGFLHGNATNDPGDYLRKLAESGETFNEDRLKAARKYLEENLKVPPAHLRDPVTVFRRAQRDTGIDSFIDQLVLGADGEGSSIEFRVISSPAVEDWAGSQLMALRGHVQSYHPVSAPPRTLRQALRDEGEILTAVVVVFVRKPQDKTGATQPLVMRLWYDTQYKTWRRSNVLTYPMRTDEETEPDLWVPAV